jgi:hypothetical protein
MRFPWPKKDKQQPAAPEPAPAPLAAQVQQEVAERGPMPEEWQEEAVELFAGAPELEEATIPTPFFSGPPLDIVAEMMEVYGTGPAPVSTASNTSGPWSGDAPQIVDDSAAGDDDSVADSLPWPATTSPVLGLYAPGQPDSPNAWKRFWASGWAEWLAGESGRALTAPEAAKTISFLAGVTVTQKSVESQRQRMRTAGTLPPATAKGGRRKPAPTDDERRAAAEKLPEVPVPAAPSDVPIVTYLPSGRVNWVPLAPWLLANAELGATELARLLSAKAEKPIPPKNVQMTISYLRHRDDDPQDREPAAPKPLPPEPPVVIAGGDGNGEEEPNAGAVLAEMLENPPSTLCRPVHPGAVPARRVPVVTTPRPAPAPPAPVDRGEWHDTDDAALEASLGRICDEKCDLTGKPRLYVLGRMIVALVGELR